MCIHIWYQPPHTCTLSHITFPHMYITFSTHALSTHAHYHITHHLPPHMNTASHVQPHLAFTLDEKGSPGEFCRRVETFLSPRLLQLSQHLAEFLNKPKLPRYHSLTIYLHPHHPPSSPPSTLIPATHPHPRHPPSSPPPTLIPATHPHPRHPPSYPQPTLTLNHPPQQSGATISVCVLQ